MSAWSIHLEYEELRALWRIFHRSHEAESPHDGIWVRSVNGHRRWTGTCGPLLWEVTGGATQDRIDPRCLPTRLLWHALDLAFEAEDRSVIISTPDDTYGVVTSDAGSTVIDLPDNEGPGDYPRYIIDRASVTVSRRHLFRLLDRAAFVPTGMEHPARVPIELIVEEDHLAAYAGWQREGGLRTTHRIPARTTGRTRAAIPVLHLLDLIRELDDDEEITLRFPEDESLPLLIEAEWWRATLLRAPTSSRRFHAELGQALANATGQPARTLDQGVFSVEWNERSIRAQLIDNPVDTVRITTVVVDDVEPTYEVLEQLNEINAGLVGARVWLHEETVVAGIDLPCQSIDTIETALGQLDTQINGLDVYLSAFGQAAV